MNHRKPLSWACVCALVTSACLPSPAFAADPEGSALLKSAQQQIAAWHAGQKSSQRQLRMVYFIPSDRDPLANHEERLDRILNDVSNFYREGFQRFGLEGGALPLEKKDGKLVIHEVRGKLPASGYNYESGTATAAEIREALKGEIDMATEHVLIIYALCRKEPDGRYVFDAPYYGGAPQSNQSGICHAADCELLDPLLLTAKDRNMVYTEHYYPRVEQTVAKFNSWYLGGIAHELGHGLGLPHDNGNPGEKGSGESLMGGGNLHYRENLWGGGSPAYFSRGSALQLVSHPLITGSDRGRGEPVNGTFETLSFTGGGGLLTLTGTASDSVPAYGAIAYLWPTTARSDHGAVSFPAVLEKGAFNLKIPELTQGNHHLKLASLHVNGAIASETFEVKVDSKGAINLADLNAEWLVDRAELAILWQDPKARGFTDDATIASAPTPEAIRKLRVLRSLLEPAAPVELATVTGDEAYLSDAAWTLAEVGWGKPVRNAFWFDAGFQSGAFLVLGGRFHDKGLYAHSPSCYGFSMGRKWKTLTATIGLRDGAAAQGSAVFIVRGDGKELYRSAVLRAGKQAKVSLDISQVDRLELVTEGGEGHNHNSWAIWADSEVRR